MVGCAGSAGSQGGCLALGRPAAGVATNATISAVAGSRSPEMRKRYSHAENGANGKAVAVLDNTSRVQRCVGVAE